ncbi:ABC transporter permease [Labrys sp. KNU-23]|uniref:FtsX-like permease family protein n=1 Tax=Labrys sp. KNU-23 TaxID=2789216 RepID=UPI0011F070F8|nr:ABC transporter permease [Labrys sp. KNU-23]QEN88386.1 ABC transporter permease [Labrys sp. KNU-23]
MIRFILADLRRVWPGALAVVLLVALATALGVGVVLQERAMRLGSARAADRFDLVIGAAGSETQLVLSSVFLQPSPLPLMPAETLRKLASDPRVAWVAPIGFGDSYQGKPIVGTTTALVNALSDGLAEGRAFAAEGEAVVGAAAGIPLGTRIKPSHGMAEEGGHAHTELAYTVVGRLKPGHTAWDKAVLVPVQAVWHLHGLGHAEEAADHDAHSPHAETKPGDAEHGEAGHEEHDEHGHEGAIDAAAPLDESFANTAAGVPAVLVKPRTIADAYKLRQAYRGEGTLAVFPAEVLTRLYATLGDARTVLVAVAAGAQLLVAAALIFVTVIHIGQRRRQIGALRALGTPRFTVLAIVWSELFVLLALGIATGFALGYLGALTISSWVTSWSGMVLPVAFTRTDLGLAALLAGFAALLGLAPALLAYRQSPAAALRG